MKRTLVLLTLVACIACGGARAKDAMFPEQAVLDALPPVVPKPLPDAVKASHVTNWTMTGPAPATYAPGEADPSQPTAAIVAAHAKASKGIVKAAGALDCYAREAARQHFRE